MYRPRDRKTAALFAELFPFGGRLDPDNRWLRIAEMIPWDELETEYAKAFSDIGRPATDARLLIGLMLLKHMTDESDREIVAAVLENPYMQAFCGLEQFATREVLEPSTLSKMRDRLGAEFFQTLEKKTYKVLIERRIIKGKGMLVDATVFPEEIKYPNDVGLLNDVREWIVRTIKRLGGKKRTQCRKARQEYLAFAKKRVKRKKVIRQAKRRMIQHVRRNLRQIREVVENLRLQGQEVRKKIKDKIRVAETILAQQVEMYKRKVQRIANRIVSFYRPYVRPIKRGKPGRDVEFGAKGALSYVGGFLFLDYLEHAAFPEEQHIETHIRNFVERFGRKPAYAAMDRKYGSRETRDKLARHGIRVSLRPLGRPPRQKDRWFKRKQKERNRIEGAFGVERQCYSSGRVRYRVKDGSEIWIRSAILAMNLKTAMVKS
jgi:IS5 family transposase